MASIFDDEKAWGEHVADEGRWQRARGSIRELWGDLTDQELEQSKGSWDQLVGGIKEKTGETYDAVERKLRQIFS